METVRLLYPDWIVVAIILILFFLAFVGIVYFCVSIKFIHYINSAETTTDPVYYIKDIDGNNIINIEEIEQISQGYNNTENEYEIIYYLKSNNQIKETFDNRLECLERFDYLHEILNS